MTNNVDTAKKAVNAMNRECAARIAFEDSIKKHSAANKVARYCSFDMKSKKTTLKEAFFQKLLDANIAVDFAFINNSLRENARFNVYAIEKAMLNLRSIVADKLIVKANKYCVAMILHCLNNRNNESFTFNRQHALVMLNRAQASTQFSRDDMQIKFNVGASTSSTQVSSSFRMLEALNVLKFDETVKERSVVSDVNYNHALVKLVARTYNIDLAQA